MIDSDCGPVFGFSVEQLIHAVLAVLKLCIQLLQVKFSVAGIVRVAKGVVSVHRLRLPIHLPMIAGHVAADRRHIDRNWHRKRLVPHRALLMGQRGTVFIYGGRVAPTLSLRGFDHAFAVLHADDLG